MDGFQVYIFLLHGACLMCLSLDIQAAILTLNLQLYLLSESDWMQIYVRLSDIRNIIPGSHPPFLNRGETTGVGWGGEVWWG